MPPVHYYAKRLLNPFRGVLHCIELDGANAVTSDGKQWQLYIAIAGGYKLLDFDGLTAVHSPDIKFGSWSRAGGLQRAPLLSRVDYAQVEVAGEQLLQVVMEYEPLLPFPQQDLYELWLVDQQDQPMVLLESHCSLARDQAPTMQRWTTGEHCRQHFADTSLCTDLEQAIKRHAHRHQPLRWYQRQDDRLLPLDNDCPAPESVPESLFREQWDDAGLDHLSNLYLQWQAPYLLLLETLSPARRAELEQAAASQARLVAELHHLYPAIADPVRLNAIRVQARLQQVGN